MTLAVDFERTILENQFPRIGKSVQSDLERLKRFQEAVASFKPKRKRSSSNGSPKGIRDKDLIIPSAEELRADICIDDRNSGGLLG